MEKHYQYKKKLGGKMSVIIVGWMDPKVRKPDIGELISIRLNDTTVTHNHEATAELIQEMKNQDALWHPTIQSPF